MTNRFVAFIPNSLTTLNLISGCVAIIFAFNYTESYGCLTGAEMACLMIGAATVFDFLDGASARLLKAYSLIGKELDSLADMVSFGVAPAMLMLNMMLGYSQIEWLCYIALFIPAMGALRLAKFNIDDSQSTTFKGLPIPANAIFWIGMSGWFTRYGYPGTVIMAVIIVAVSLAMVSNIKMFSLKIKSLSFHENVRRYVVIIATAAFVWAYGLSGFIWAIVLYLLVSILSRREL